MIRNSSSGNSPDDSPAWASYGADQAIVETFVRTRFGDGVFENIEERAARVMEEGIELFDSEAKGEREDARAKAHKMVDVVFDKKRGDQNQEAGGVITTLLAYCAAKFKRLDRLAAAEIARVHTLSREHFRKRQNEKADQGVAARPD